MSKRSAPRSPRPLAEGLEARRLLANDYPVGTNPNDIVATDFNADGRPDLAVMNKWNSVISVLIGRGNGTFNPPTNVAVGSSPKSIVSGDFNGDGKIDLATGNGSGAGFSYSVLLGNGSGGFAVATTTLSSEPTQMAVGDFTGDGKPDLATGGFAFNAVSIFAGVGNGTFASPVSIAAGASATYVAAGDVDGDGDADLVMSDNAPMSSTMAVLRSNNNGTFAAPITFGVGARAHGMIVRDLNADGRGDIVYASLGTPNVRVVMSQTGNTFAANGGVTFATLQDYIKLADVNGDGAADIVGSTGRVALGNGGGTFAAPFTAAAGIAGYNEVVADLNADGRADLAAIETYGTGTDGVLKVRLGLGDGQFVDNILAAPVTFTGPSTPDVSISDDFDNDGTLDLAVVRYISSGSVTIYHGNGDGTFGAALVSLSGDSFPHSIAVGDFDNNGAVDLAVGSTTNTVSVWGNAGNGTSWASFGTLTGGTAINDIAAGDFNGDGIIDLAACNFAATGSVRRWLGTGTGTFGSGSNTLTGSAFPTDITAGDVNNDGRADLVTANVTSSGATTSVLLGTAAGGFTALSGAILGGNGLSVALGDFRGDSNIDLAAGTDGNGGRYHILQGNGTGNFAFSAAAVETGTNSVPLKLVAGDFNNDSLLDLVSGDNSGNVRVLLGNGAGGLGVFPSVATVAANAVSTGDFNGDGRLDVAASGSFSAGVTSVSVLLNQTPYSLASLATVSAGVLTTTITTTGGLFESDGRIGMFPRSGFVGQTFNATGIKSIVINGSSSSLTYSIYGDLGRSGGMRRVSLTTPQALMTSFSSQHLDTLTIPQNGTFALRPNTGTGLLRVRSLNLSSAAGNLDLNTGDFVYDYTGSSPIAALRDQIRFARNVGAWDGYGINSAAAAANTARTTGLGYMEATDYQAIYGGSAKFAGETLDSTAVVVRYTYYGDTDLDRGVSIADFNRLTASFGTIGRLWIDGDFDYDNGVSITDFNVLAANFGRTLAVAALFALQVNKGIAPAKRSA